MTSEETFKLGTINQRTVCGYASFCEISEQTLESKNEKLKFSDFDMFSVRLLLPCIAENSDSILGA